MKRSTIAAVLLFFSLVAAGASEIDVSIRFFDKHVYYAGSDGDPIQIEVTLHNNSATTWRFKLADERSFSVDLNVRTISNKEVDFADILKQKRMQDQPVFFREVAIEPGESLSFNEDLRDFADLKDTGSFVIQAHFYPELYGKREVTPPIDSNKLALTLYPTPLAEDGKTLRALDKETGAVLVREKMPPDQVIEYMIVARQRSQWEKFFLYLDLEEMLKRDGTKKREWIASSEEGRKRMIADYRSKLQGEKIDGDIATLPTGFEVVGTRYSGNKGQVEVIEKFKAGTYTESKRYTYYLLRRDDIWMVVSYTVTNMGTE